MHTKSSGIKIRVLEFTLILLGGLAFSAVAEQGLGTLVYPPFKHTWGIHKGTEAKLDMLLGNATDFDNPQGLAVTRLHAWEDPKTEKDDDELVAYGVNSGRDQIIYNKSMYALDIFGQSGSGVEQFDSPAGIAADPSGDVFVCDTGNRRVVHLFNTGKKLKWEGIIGEGILEEPFDVCLTEADTIFVTDRARGTIEVFSYEGEHIRSLEGLVNPTGIAVDNPKITKTRYGKRFIVVIDGDGTLIRKMSYDGKVMRTTRLSDVPNAKKFNYIALDFYDNAWVTDSVSCVIHKFDIDLDYIASWGEPGTGDGQFFHPTGIAIWRRFGQIVVSERHSAQYLWIGTDIASLETENSENRDGEKVIKINLVVTDRSYISIDISRDGKPVRELFYRKRLKQGKNILTWDLRDDNDLPVSPGTYDISFTLEPTYSSFDYFEKSINRRVTLDG